MSDDPHYRTPGIEIPGRSAAGPGVLASEDLTAYERWELPHVSDNVSEGMPDFGRGPLTASRLKEIQRQAYDEAYAEAYAVATEKGFQRGQIEGQVDGRREFSSILGALNDALNKLAQPFAELDAEVEATVVTLATTVARQLLFDALDAEPERIVAVVRAGLQALPSAERQVQLELHPDDLGIVREALSQLPGQGWELRENAGLTRGGCLIESRGSRIDASVENRLENVISHILGGTREEAPTSVSQGVPEEMTR